MTTHAQSKFTIKPRGTYVMCHGDSVRITAIKGYSLYSWNTGQKGQSIVAYKAGTYIGYGYIGRTRFSDTLILKIHKQKTLNLYSVPKSQTICQGDSVIIEASSGFRSYSWTDSKKGQRVVYKPKSSLSVVCRALDSNGCYYKEDIYITVKNCTGCPKVLKGDPHICDDKDSVVLEAASGYKSYKWLNGPSGRTYTVKKAGWYYIEFSDGTTKCKDSILVTKGKLKFGIWSKPHPAVICKGDTIELGVPYKGFKSFWWSTGHRYNDFKFAPDSSVKVVVEAVDENGCSYRDVIEITVKDTCQKSCDVLEVKPRKILCGDHDSVVLTAKTGYAKYLWYDKHDGKHRTVKKEGWYWVEVISQAGDTCRDSVYITKVKPLQLKLYSSPSPAVICPGDKVVIEATGGFLANWWNTGHRNVNRVVLTNITSTKGIVVEAVDSNGCSARAVLYVTVKDTCKKKCDVLGVWPKKVLCGDHDSVKLEAVSGYKTYKWNDGKGGRLRTVKKEGWYWVKVVSHAGDTCTDSMYIKKVKPRELKLSTNPNPPKVCKGKKLVIEASGGFLAYGWSTRDTGDRIVLYPTKSGKVVLEAIDSNGCVVRKELRYTVDTCSGAVGETHQLRMKVYPNPSNQEVFVKVQDANKALISIYDNLGRQKLAVLSNKELTKLDVGELPNGLYLISYEADNVSMRQLLRIIRN
jgi:hypothetical protein